MTDMTDMTDQQRVLIAELIAVQARIDAKFAALWDLETSLLARIRQGPPGVTTSPALPVPTISEAVAPPTPWQRSAQPLATAQPPGHQSNAAA